MEIATASAHDIHQALRNGLISCADLAESVIQRTKAAVSLNCYVSFDADQLLEDAASIDQRLRAGENLPLLGVPVALKDNIEALGLPSSAGTASLRAFMPHSDSTVAKRLREAGALLTGKVGMQELAFGITSNNAVTGAVRNPWDPTRIPGGSSGGSGAAVAAGLVPVAIGTDTGGSIRVPAALCGVAGFRPTVGRVDGTGIAPISHTRDTAGPLARSVADLALFDAVLTGRATTLSAASLEHVRLGLPQTGFWDDLDDGVAQVALNAIECLREAGATFVPVTMPDVGKLSSEIGFVVALYEFARDMPRYLKDRGTGVTFEALIEEIGSPDVRAIAAPLLGTGTVSEATYQQALEQRRKLQAIYSATFRDNDVAALVFPTVPCTAAPVEVGSTFVHNGLERPTFATFIRNADPGSNAAIPGLSLPVGLSNGLPVGLALDGPSGTDRALLALGVALESALPVPSQPSLNQFAA